MILHIDYETRSAVNLFTEGAYRYAMSDTTSIICCGWAFDDDDIKIWIPGEPMDWDMASFLQGAGGPRSVHAHNAQFERLITDFVLGPMLGWPTSAPIETWYCTAAQARARGLPGALEDLGTCLNINVKKDRRGKELIKLLCIPRKGVPSDA